MKVNKYCKFTGKPYSVIVTWWKQNGTYVKIIENKKSFIILFSIMQVRNCVIYVLLFCLSTISAEETTTEQGQSTIIQDSGTKITESPRKTDFDILQIIFSDAEVIEKRNSGSETKKDLDTAANTVFRPLFVYKRQSINKKN